MADSKFEFPVPEKIHLPKVRGCGACVCDAHPAPQQGGAYIAGAAHALREPDFLETLCDFHRLVFDGYTQILKETKT